MAGRGRISLTSRPLQGPPGTSHIHNSGVEGCSRPLRSAQVAEHNSFISQLALDIIRKTIMAEQHNHDVSPIFDSLDVDLVVKVLSQTAFSELHRLRDEYLRGY